MKKILALFMMFLISGNFLFAQGGGDATVTASVQPKLNFQAVVRDAQNHLVFENEMDVVININYVILGENRTYSETHNDVMTNHNGLLTVIIGGADAEDVNGSLFDVDWSNATIEAVITFTPNPTLNPDGVTYTTYDETTVTVTSDVTAVPYALQTGSTRLNTDMIVNYISGIKLGTNGTPDQKRDVLLILDAIRNNAQGLKNDLKDTIVEYMKTRMDIAREIFHYYLDHVDSADVWDTYNQLMANTTAKNAVRNVIIDFIKNHKADAMEVLEYYAENCTVDDLQDLFYQFDHNSRLKDAVRAVVATELEGYLTTNHYVSTALCPDVEICALANQDIFTTCPTAASFIGETTKTGAVFTTTINNPDNLSFSAKYHYMLEDRDVTLEATKDGNTVTAEVGSDLPTGTVVKLKIHIYGHDECDMDVNVFTF